MPILHSDLFFRLLYSSFFSQYDINSFVFLINKNFLYSAGDNDSEINVGKSSVHLIISIFSPCNSLTIVWTTSSHPYTCTNWINRRVLSKHIFCSTTGISCNWFNFNRTFINFWELLEKKVLLKTVGAPLIKKFDVLLILFLLRNSKLLHGLLFLKFLLELTRPF